MSVEECGCCAGVQASTPQGIFNRPALSAVSYRIGTWADFHASLVAGLSASARPALARLATRDDSDFTLGLIDAFACTADVLTFYQERTANESWLGTAVERVSLQEMGKLIGYRLRPGVAAETQLAFTLETPPQPPAGASDEPGAFVSGVPASIPLPAGLKVQSVPGPDEKPQTFETVEAVAEARPAWNAMRPWLSEPVVPKRFDTFAYLAGVRTGLKAGDAVVLVDAEFIDHAEAAPDRWDFRILSRVEPDLGHDRTRIEWTRGLGSINPPKQPAAMPRVFALRKRAAVFGHNAPMWASMPAVFKDEYPGGIRRSGGFGFGGLTNVSITIGGSKYTSDWPNFFASARSPGASIAWLDLDSVVADLAAGSLVVLGKGDFNHPSGGSSADTYVELYRVRATSEVSRAQFALSGKVTRLELAGENFAAEFYEHPRDVSVFAVSEELALAEYPVDDAVAGDTLPLAVAADALLPGRRLIVRGSSADGQALVQFATIHSVSAQGERCTVRLNEPLAATLRRDSVVVHGNVALASHGESVTTILGSGNAALPFAAFELKQLPLTYRAAATESGAAAAITLRVGGIEWTERASLYGAAPAERVFTLDTDAAARLWLRFGDGIAGARLPSGQNNLVAVSRKGLGVAGNVRADSLTQLSTRPLGLKGVANPAAALGGTEPEAEGSARRSMPMATRTLGRVVSLLDYEDFALAFAGIAKAQAAVLPLRGGTTIVVTVAAEAGAPIGSASPVWSHLLDALHAAGDPLVKVQLLAAQLSTVRVGLKVKVDPAHEAATVLAAVEAALRAALAFDARALAQPVQQSQVVAAAQAVAGVVAIDLDWLYGGSAPAAQTLPSLQPRLLASRARVGAGGVALPAELLTLDPGPLHSLLEIT